MIVFLFLIKSVQYWTCITVGMGVSGTQIYGTVSLYKKIKVQTSCKNNPELLFCLFSLGVLSKVSNTYLI